MTVVADEGDHTQGEDNNRTPEEEWDVEESVDEDEVAEPVPDASARVTGSPFQETNEIPEGMLLFSQLDCTLTQ